MNLWLIVGIIGIVAAVIFFVLKSRRKGVFAPGGVLGTDPSVFDIRIITRPQGTTPMGMKVCGWTPPSDASRIAADAGVAQTFDIAENVYGYSGFRRHANYTASFLPRSPKCQEAGFLITKQVEPGTNYDGSEFDKDPRPGYIAVCVAGLFQLVNSDPGIFIVDDAGMTFNAAAYEAEHAVLLDADPQKFNDTQYHQGGGHPILPDTRSAALFSPRKQQAAEITLADGSRVCVLLTK